MSVHFYQHTSRYTGRDISITATYLGGLGLKSGDKTSLGKFSPAVEGQTRTASFRILSKQHFI